MQEIIIQVMNQFGYFGVAFLIMIENIFPPIPSEVILTFGGFMTTYSELGIIGMIIAATIGSVLGALILYFVGRLLSVERLEKLVSGRLGKVLRLKPEDITIAECFPSCPCEGPNRSHQGKSAARRSLHIRPDG